MNTVRSLLPTCMALFGFAAMSGVAVIQTPGLIQVECVLNGGLIAPDDTGDTLDYLKFEVLTTTSITITSGFNSALLLQLAQFLGRDDEFGFIGNPYRLQQTSSTEWSTLTRTLEPGIYVTTMGVRDKTSYDIFDGFTAVNPEGGGFTVGPYGYSIAGDVRALEFWDGELDGTFKITHYDVPEPSAGMLGLAAAGLLTMGRKRRSGSRL